MSSVLTPLERPNGKVTEIRRWTLQLDAFSSLHFANTEVMRATTTTAKIDPWNLPRTSSASLRLSANKVSANFVKFSEKYDCSQSLLLMTAVRTTVSTLFTHLTKLSLSFLLKTLRFRFLGAENCSLWSSVASTTRAFVCPFDPLLRSFRLHAMFRSSLAITRAHAV